MQPIRVPIPLRKNPYYALVGENLLPSVGKLIQETFRGPQSCAVITDSNVAPLYAQQVIHSLQNSGHCAHLITVPAGESSKSMPQAATVCDEMIAAGLDRSSLVLALGGGVVGDLAGFVAAIFHRGIPFVQIPTTLLAQVDSSVGGKTGVNTQLGKNLIGAFHQPALVIADTLTLKTLPPREFHEGMAEIIKHGIIRDRDLIHEAPSLANNDIPKLIARNIAIKAAIVCQDQFETSGLRVHLNFGHTIGHAIEQAAGYGTLLHGEAIAIGIAAELELSVRHAGLPQHEACLALDALAACNLPLQIPAHLEETAIMAALTKDKKFTRGHVRITLTRSLGSAFLCDSLSLNHIRSAIKACQASI